MVLENARLVSNYDIDATGAGLWTDTTHYRATVPAGKRWYLMGGVISRAVSSTAYVYVYNAAAQLVMCLLASAAATTTNGYPQNYGDVSVQAAHYPIPLDAGWYVEAVFGTAQNASSYASCVVLEVSL